MNNDPVENVYGMRMSEWIALVPGELPQDAVGLWQIVPAGLLRFNLKGSDLVNYVRRNIYALVDAGAIPVVGGRGTGFDWVYQSQYGSTKEEIASKVIEEWQRIGNDIGELANSVWFARPRPGTNYIKMD